MSGLNILEEILYYIIIGTISIIWFIYGQDNTLKLSHLIGECYEKCRKIH